jgi:hypothetical protein
MIAIKPIKRLGERAAGHVHAVQPPVALAHDQARLLQHAHVPRDGGRGHLERLGELADRGRTRDQAFEHAAPCGVGERRKHGVEGVELTVNHVVNYNHNVPQGARGKLREGGNPTPAAPVGFGGRIELVMNPVLQTFVREALSKLAAPDAIHDVHQFWRHSAGRECFKFYVFKPPPPR